MANNDVVERWYENGASFNFEQNGTIVLYPKNAKNRKVAGQTLIHEMSHFRYRIGGSQRAETVCLAMELMHSRNRNWITETEWEYLSDLIKEAYNTYEWEVYGDGDYEQFDFIKPDNEHKKK